MITENICQRSILSDDTCKDDGRFDYNSFWSLWYFFAKMFETSMLPRYLTARGASSKYLLCVLRLNSLKYQEQRLEALGDHLEQRLVALISAPPQEIFDGLVHTSALSARLLWSWRPGLINLHLRASAYDKLLKKVGFEEEKNLQKGDLLFFYI